MPGRAGVFPPRSRYVSSTLWRRDFAIDPSVDGRRRDGRRRGVAGQVQTRDDARLRGGGGVGGRVFQVERVKHAVPRVIGIEDKAGETGGEVELEGEFRDQPGASAAAVEIQITGEGLLLLVEDVERPVKSLTKKRGRRARPACS